MLMMTEFSIYPLRNGADLGTVNLNKDAKNTPCAYRQDRDRLLHEPQMMLEHHLQLMKEP